MGNINQELLYTDQENVWAAQMAYCNIDDTVITSTLLYQQFE